MSKKQTLFLQKVIGDMFKAIPYYDSEQILEKAKAPHLKYLPASIRIWLIAIAYIRHNYTDYDELLTKGFGKEAARHYTRNQINSILEQWRASKQLNE